MTTRIKLQLAGVGVAIALSALFTSAAGAASVVSNRACHREGEAAFFAGIGFQPGQLVAVSLDGRQIGTQPAAANGSVLGRIPSLTPIPRSELRRSLTMVQVTNPALTGTAVFTETKIYVVTKPSRFRPGRRLRMRAGGFYGAGPTLYAHVRGPKRRNLRIGRLAGPCGKVSATRKVLLKRGDPVGLDPTQFDTSRRYIGRAAPVRFRKVYGIRRVIRFSDASSLWSPPLGRDRWVPAGQD